jgi:hypothetical protein
MFVATGCSTTSHYLVPNSGGIDVFVKVAEAEQVRFASSRDDFQLHDARRNRDGFWWVTVPGMGEFKYFFMVDGAVHIPDCSYREYDDFGMQNCIYQE